MFYEAHYVCFRLLEKAIFFLVSANTENLHLTNTTRTPPWVIYDMIYTWGKWSCGGSITWEPPRIWYQVWHLPNCCRMRGISWYYINHCLPVRPLPTYYSLIIMIYQYNSSIVFFVTPKYISKEGRNIVLGWQQQQIVLQYTDDLRCNNPEHWRNVSVLSGLGECFALGYVYFDCPDPENK